MMEHWHWWTLIALVLMIGEAFLPGLVLGSLAVGALAGGLSSAFTDWWEIQFVAASVGTLVALVFLRPLAMKKWFSGESVATGIDALPGRRVRITSPIESGSRRGRGSVDGDDWLIEFPEDWSGQRIDGVASLNDPAQHVVGDELEVLRVESNVLVVVPIKKTN